MVNFPVFVDVTYSKFVYIGITIGIFLLKAVYEIFSIPG